MSAIAPERRAERDRGRALAPDQQALASDPAALKLARALAAKAARRLWNYRDEIESAAMLGLVHAARLFDPSWGLRFLSYAHRRIRGEIADWQRRNALRGYRRWHGRMCRGAPAVLSLDSPHEDNDGAFIGRNEIPADGLPVGWEIESEDTVEQLARLVPHRQGEAIRRLLLHAATPTKVAVGVEMGCCEARISQLTTLAVERLRDRRDIVMALLGNRRDRDEPDPSPEIQKEIEARIAAMREEKYQAALNGHPDREAHKPPPPALRQSGPSLYEPTLDEIPDTPAIRKVREAVEAEAAWRRSPEGRAEMSRLLRYGHHAARRRSTDQRLLDAAESLSPDGGPVSIRDLTRQTGVAAMTAQRVRNRLREQGRWRWPDGSAGKRGSHSALPTTPRREEPTVSTTTTADPPPSVNGEHQPSFKQRVLAACQQLQREGQPISGKAICEVMGVPYQNRANVAVCELRQAGKLPPSERGRSNTPTPAPKPKPTPAPKPTPSATVNPGSPLSGVAADLTAAATIAEHLASLDPGRARRVLTLILESIPA